MLRSTLVIVLVVPITAAAQQPTAVLKHDGWVAAVAFSPDGKTLASAGSDNVVRLWEVGSWKPTGVFKGHTDCITSLAFGPKNYLMTGSFDGTVKEWNLSKKEAGRNYKVHRGPVLALIAGETGGYMSGGVDGRVWSHPPSSTSWTHRSWVNSLAVNGDLFGDRRAVASGSSDGTVFLMSPWAIGRRDKGVSLDGGAGEVRCVAFSPNGHLLAAGNRYHTVRVWEVVSQKELKTLGGHMSEVWSIAFSPDGKTLAAADTDWKKPSKVKLWDTKTWTERGAIEVPGEVLALAYSPGGEWLAVGSWDKTVRVFAVGK